MRLVTAAARDFGDVLDGENSDDDILMSSTKQASNPQSVQPLGLSASTPKTGAAFGGAPAPAMAPALRTVSEQPTPSYSQPQPQLRALSEPLGSGTDIASALSSDDEDLIVGPATVGAPSLVRMNPKPGGSNARPTPGGSLQPTAASSSVPSALPTGTGPPPAQLSAVGSPGGSSTATKSGGATGTPKRDAGIMQMREVVIDPSSGAGVGISCSDVPAYLAEPGLGGTAGVLICGLTTDGLAATAGLFVGDLIVRVNGQVAEKHMQVVEAVNKCFDAKQTMTLQVLASSVEIKVDRSKGKIGMCCEVLLPSGGVLVTGLAENSTTIPLGMQPGMLILSVNGKLPTSHKNAVELVDDKSFSIITFVCRRIATVVTLKLQLGGDTGLVVRDHELGVGCVVSAVATGGAAAAAGLNTGDVLFFIGSDLIRTAEEATKLLQSVQGLELQVTKRL